MGKILACDYGLRRIGIAITDELQMIASPLETVATNEIWEYLSRVIPAEQIEIVVVGEPKGLRGEATDATAAANNFAKRLPKRFDGVQVERVNEMFTSKMASRALVAGGAKKSQRQKKGEIDKISAAIILQDFLASRGSIF
ncbi:MAG: Holliday junction resolvase RuvX [Flavobacteriales bacterium]|nr:Holliday junction resolvase RuvX [Flavobacteriales bacterium]